MFKHCEKMHDRVTYQTLDRHYECYLHEDNLRDKLYVVLERFGKPFDEYLSVYTDNLAEAQTCYAAAKERTEARILGALLRG
ncbi:MAG: hypothetical protein ACEQSK_06935 [Sphingomonadaceae bacterium]